MSVPPSSGQDGQPDPYEPVAAAAGATAPDQSAPGRPGPYGPAPGQPGSFPPPGVFTPPPPAKKSKLRWLRLVIPVVVLIVAAIAAVSWFKTSPDRAAAGDCLSITEFKQGTEPSKVDCNDPSANVKVGVRLDDASASCPDGGDYDQYSVSGSTSYKLCLMLNAHDGECVANFTDTTQGYKAVNCSDPTAEVKIIKVVDGVAADSACDGTNSDGALKYPQPPTTVCASNLKNHT